MKSNEKRLTNAANRAQMISDRRRSNASGTHGDRRERRIRDRSSIKRNAIAESA
jgi:hypothetical protein